MDNIFIKDIFEETTNPQNNRAPLSRAMAESVLGESLDNVIIYDLINNQPIKRTYNSHYVVGNRDMFNNAARFKKLCAKSSVIAGRVPVAVVAKTYSHARSMEYNRYGHDVAGNVIFYDPETKKYSAFARRWMNCGEHACDVAASEQALYDTMDAIVRYFRTTEAFARQKVVVPQDPTKKTFWNTIVDFVSKNRSK